MRTLQLAAVAALARRVAVGGAQAAAGDALAQTVTIPFTPVSAQAIPIPPWGVAAVALLLAALGAWALWRRQRVAGARRPGLPPGALLLAAILIAGTSGAWIPRVFAVVSATSFDLTLPGPAVSPALAVGVDITVHNATGIPVTLGAPIVSAPHALSSPSSAPQCVSGLVLVPLSNCFLKVVLPTGPVNQAPQVNAGPDQAALVGQATPLSGSATDDGLPNPPATLTYTWSLQSGPGTVAFGNIHAAATNATFPVAGQYTLRLTVSDSALSGHDDVTITAGDVALVLQPVPNATIPVNTTLSLGLDGQSTDALAVLTYGLTAGPAGATVSPAGVFTFTPDRKSVV